MALVLADRVRETTTTTGTGSVTLAGAYTGFQTFSAAVGTGNSTYYTIANVGSGEWEVGIGTYSSGGNLLSRTTVLASSNGGSLVNFGAGAKDVFVTQPAERALYIASAGTGLESKVTAFTNGGIVYASSTSALSTGSALVFDGTNLGLGGSATNYSGYKTFSITGGASGGVIDLSTSSGLTAGGMQIAATPTSTNIDAVGLSGGTASNLIFRVGTYGAVFEGFRLTSTSLYTASTINVGIGTSSPTAKLNISVASAAVNGTKGVRIANPAGTIVMLECGSGGDSFVGTESGSDFNIRTNNAIVTTFLTSGNVGFGETNPVQKLHFKGSGTTYALAETTGSGTSSGFRMKAGAGTDFTLFTTQGGNQFGIYNNTTSTQPLTIDASGNLGIGTSSPAYKLDVVGTGSIISATRNDTNRADMIVTNSGGTVSFGINSSTGGWLTNGLPYYGYILGPTSSSYGLQFGVGASNTAALTIDPSGNLLVGSTGQPVGGITARLAVSQSIGDYTAILVNSQATAANCYGASIQYTAAAPNGTGNVFLVMKDTGGDRAYFRSNGGLSNYSANNTNLSDERTKTDIQDAGGYLAKICAIPVRTFKYKDQTDDLLSLGVIAQEVEDVAPELVDVSGFGETPEDGVPLKAIYQTDLQYALMKSIQELKAEFDAYKASHS